MGKKRGKQVMRRVKVVGISGSRRASSFNTSLLNLAISRLENLGAEVNSIDLRALDIPFYDADYEKANGLPADVKTVREKIRDSDLMLVATPEYNGFPPGILKNVLDWISRKNETDDPPLEAYKGKVAALMSATIGGSGGVRALTTMTTQLNYLGVMVLPDKFSLPHASKYFGDTENTAALTGLDEFLKLSTQRVVNHVMSFE